MTLDAAVKLYIDWDKDGFTSGDEVQTYVMDGSASLGIADPAEMSRVAPIGQLTLTLDNSDRRFSPGNVGGPYYGKLVHGLPVRMTATVAAVVYILFTGTITDWQIASNLFGPRTVTLLAEDKMADYQAETALALPLQQLCKADDLLRLIGAAVFRCPAATGTLTFVDVPTGTVTIGDQVYTFAASPSAPYQVAQSDLSLYKAINNSSPGTGDYGTGTLANTKVAATAVHPTFGSLSHTTSLYGPGFDAFAHRLSWPDDVVSRSMSALRLYVGKVGSPGNATIKIVKRDPVTEKPGTTLVDPNATATLLASAITPSGAAVTVTFPGSFTVHTDDFVVVEFGTHDTSNYIAMYNKVASVEAYYKTGGGGWGSATTTGLVLRIDGLIELTAKARGTWGNAIALSSSSANIVASGATLSGGLDGPSGTLDYDIGSRVFEYAADAWGDEQVNAATVIGQIVNAEYGFFVIGRDGQPVFRNGSFLLAAANRPADLVLNNTHSELSNLRVSRADCKNVVSVTYTPRLTLTHGVIAQSGGAFRVDPNRAIRWSSSVPAAPSTLKLPFKDAAGNSIGALDVDTLIAGTHFKINDRADGTGFDYTNTLPQHVWASWVITATGIEITFRSDATGALYILDLQVTGTGLSPFSSETVTAEDAASISLYGRLPDEYQLDLPVIGPFPPALASYLLSRQKNPRLLFDGAAYDSPGTAGSLHLFSLDLLDLVEISDAQSGVSSQKCLVTGVDYKFAAGEVSQVTLYTRPVPTLTYWQLGHSTYGKLGTSTRLAL